MQGSVFPTTQEAEAGRLKVQGMLVQLNEIFQYKKIKRKLRLKPSVCLAPTKFWAPTPAQHRPIMVVLSCSPSTPVEAEGSELQGLS